LPQFAHDQLLGVKNLLRLTELFEAERFGGLCGDSSFNLVGVAYMSK
jgi:hypothetical protein